MEIAIILLVGYLIGAIPFGWIICKHYGLNPRTSGSGATGATQVLRILAQNDIRRPGWKFALSLLLDGLKALIPLLVVILLVSESELTHIAMAGTICLGHTRSIWLFLFDRDPDILSRSVLQRLNGGKAVSTAIGVTIALVPSEPTLALIVVSIFLFFGLGFVLSRWRMSVGSLLGTLAGAIGITILLFEGYLSLTYFAGLLGIGVLIVVMHWDNIKRIMNKKESAIIERRAAP